MAEDKEQYKKSIRFFNDREVRAVWDEEHSKWWFSVLDIIAAINEQDDYQKTRNYWKYLKIKLRKENSQLVSVTNQLKLKASDEKSYKTDTFDAEGVTLLANNKYTLISLEDCMTLQDKFVRRTYPKVVLPLLIVCISLKLCKQ